MDLLTGELSLQRGDSEQAAKHLLSAAYSTHDLNTAKRAAYAAQFGHNPKLLRQASQWWGQLAPLDPLAWQYLAQAESLDGHFDSAIDALNKELKLGGGAGLPYVAKISLNESQAVQMQLQERYKTWLTSYQNNPQLLYALALLGQTQQPHEAIGYLHKALQQVPKQLQIQILYSELLIATQQLEEANNYLQQHTQPLDRAPRQLIALHAQVLTVTGEYKLAYDYFSELVKRFPEDPNGHYSAGLLAYETQYYNEVYGHLEQFLKLRPDSHSAYYHLGLTALKQGHKQQAVGYFEQVTIGPDRLSAIVELLNLQTPKLEQTPAFFKQARQRLALSNEEPNEAPTSISPDGISAELYRLQAEHLLNLNALHEAALAYDEGLQQHPQNTALLYGRALLAQSLSELDLSESLLNKILVLQPNHVNALNALGYTYAEQGIKLSQAEVLVRKALALQPGNAAIIDSLGWVTYRQGHLRQAKQLLSKAYELLPDAEIAAHLGLVKWALGDTKGAFETWNTALIKDPDNLLIKQAIMDAQNDFQND